MSLQIDHVDTTLFDVKIYQKGYRKTFPKLKNIESY